MPINYVYPWEREAGPAAPVAPPEREQGFIGKALGGLSAAGAGLDESIAMSLMNIFDPKAREYMQSLKGTEREMSPSELMTTARKTATKDWRGPRTAERAMGTAATAMIPWTIPMGAALGSRAGIPGAVAGAGLGWLVPHTLGAMVDPSIAGRSLGTDVGALALRGGGRLVSGPAKAVAGKIGKGVARKVAPAAKKVAGKVREAVPKMGAKLKEQEGAMYLHHPTVRGGAGKRIRNQLQESRVRQLAGGAPYKVKLPPKTPRERMLRETERALSGTRARAPRTPSGTPSKAWQRGAREMRGYVPTITERIDEMLPRLAAYLGGAGAVGTSAALTSRKKRKARRGRKGPMQKVSTPVHYN